MAIEVTAIVGPSLSFDEKLSPANEENIWLGAVEGSTIVDEDMFPIVSSVKIYGLSARRCYLG